MSNYSALFSVCGQRKIGFIVLFCKATAVIQIGFSLVLDNANLPQHRSWYLAAVFNILNYRVHKADKAFAASLAED